MAANEQAEFMGVPSDTADQLQQAPTENKHGMPGPGKEFNGETDMSFGSVAPVRREFGEPGHPGSGWSLLRNHD